MVKLPFPVHRSPCASEAKPLGWQARTMTSALRESPLASLMSCDSAKSPDTRGLQRAISQTNYRNWFGKKGFVSEQVERCNSATIPCFRCQALLRGIQGELNFQPTLCKKGLDLSEDVVHLRVATDFPGGSLYKQERKEPKKKHVSIVNFISIFIYLHLSLFYWDVHLFHLWCSLLSCHDPCPSDFVSNFATAHGDSMPLRVWALQGVASWRDNDHVPRHCMDPPKAAKPAQQNANRTNSIPIWFCQTSCSILDPRLPLTVGRTRIGAPGFQLIQVVSAFSFTGWSKLKLSVSFKNLVPLRLEGYLVGRDVSECHLGCRWLGILSPGEIATRCAEHVGCFPAEELGFAVSHGSSKFAWFGGPLWSTSLSQLTRLWPQVKLLGEESLMVLDPLRWNVFQSR